jgi:hypothetical protein
MNPDLAAALMSGHLEQLPMTASEVLRRQPNIPPEALDSAYRALGAVRPSLNADGASSVTGEMWLDADGAFKFVFDAPLHLLNDVRYRITIEAPKG